VITPALVSAPPLTPPVRSLPHCLPPAPLALLPPARPGFPPGILSDCSLRPGARLHAGKSAPCRAREAPASLGRSPAATGSAPHDPQRILWLQKRRSVQRRLKNGAQGEGGPAEQPHRWIPPISTQTAATGRIPGREGRLLARGNRRSALSSTGNWCHVGLGCGHEALRRRVQTIYVAEANAVGRCRASCRAERGH